MINSVKMTNFRKHRNRTIDLQPGFTVIRGPNEASKSTIFEAVAYAIFGVGALRTPLDKTVTWGFPENTLKVELELTIDHTIYSVKRSKSGAEVTYAGGSVSGQKEVTKFLAGLMRMDINAAKRLVLSNQKEISGALEAGPKATTEMIERLADFHQIDRLLELMEAKLSLGSDATLKARLEAAQHQLATAKDLVEPDWTLLQSRLDDALALQVNLSVKVTQAEATQDEAQMLASRAATAASERQAVQRREARLQERYSAAMNEMQRLKANPVKDVADGDEQIHDLMAYKADAEAFAKAMKAYEAVKHLLGSADSLYADSRQALDANISELTTRVGGLESKFRSLGHAVQLLKKDMESGNCTFCGKDFSDLPEVKAKNAALRAKIDGHLGESQDVALALEVARGEVKVLVDISNAAKPYEDAAKRFSDYLRVDAETTPPSLSWAGPDVDAKVVELDADARIREIRAEQKVYRDYLAAVKANDDLLESFGPEREEILAAKAQLGEEDTTDYAGPLLAARQAVQEARAELTKASTAVSEAKGAQRDEQRRWDHAQASVAAAQKVVDTSEAEIKALNFNNALLKRVRAARPVIADRLWNLVLTSVSTYFSEIRGVQSVVSKGADGFLVDGEPVESFSGSTIDSLGLAIRVALVRTFLPTAPFLILDEPAAACSAERTQNMLGFILGAGFQQILLVTHEDVSEGVADNIITLGEVA